MTTIKDQGTAADRAAEDFLREFHDRTPGRQGPAVEASPTADGRTSYQLLADRVAGARRVLDLGCADGALLAVLAERGADGLAGIDLSGAELTLARRRPALAEADLRRGRAQELPFPDAAFDAVVSHMALMLMTDVEQVLAEAARVLAPGGTLAVAVGGGAVPGGAMDLFLTLARPHFTAASRAGRQLPRLGDRRSRDRDGLAALLRAAGFGPMTWDTVAIDMGGTPERVWDAVTSAFYDMTVLDDDRIAELRAAFLDASADFAEPAGTVPCGMRINLAAARLPA